MSKNFDFLKIQNHTFFKKTKNKFSNQFLFKKKINKKRKIYLNYVYIYIKLFAKFFILIWPSRLDQMKILSIKISKSVQFFKILEHFKIRSSDSKHFRI